MPEQFLRNAEKSSIDKKKERESDGAVDEARSAEEGQSDGESYIERDSFRNSVTGKSGKKNAKGKLGGLKKKGPLIAIGVLLVLVAGLIFAAQGAMPFAIVNRLIEEFNTNGVSSVLRADNILDLQLSSAPGTTLGISSYQSEAMAEHGIYSGGYGDNGAAVLAFKKNDKSWIMVTGTGKNVNVASAATKLNTKYPDANIGGSITRVTVKEAMDINEFKNAYTTASKTWRGGNSGWYDELTSLAEQVHGFQRSRWFNYDANAASRIFKKVARAGLLSADYELSEGIKDVEVDNDGSSTNSVDQPISGDTIDKLNIAAKFVSFAKGGVSLVCAGVEGFLGVQTIISAYQRLQKINLASGFMEAVQSVQAGRSDGEPMYEYTKILTTNDPETGENAMYASGMGALLTGSKASAEDASVRAVNTENALTAISNESSMTRLFTETVNDAKGLLQAYKVCNYAKGALGLANMVITMISIIPVIGQIIKGAQIVFHAVVRGAVRAAIIAAAEEAGKIIVRELIKYLGRNYLKDMATEWIGKIFGEGLVSGGNILLSANHQTGGGSPASPTKAAIFRREQEIVIAEEAKYQRSIRSPFDIDSRYTFLGSIVYSLIPLASSSGVGTTLRSVNSIMTSAVSNILPTASAVAETSFVNLAQEGDCPVLQNIETKSGSIVEIQADIYCNPVYISDQDTSAISSSGKYSPDWIIQQEKKNGYVEVDSENRVTAIKDANNNLTKYITFCGQRTSNWGIADANIAKAIDVSSTRGVLMDIVGGIANDVSDIISAATAIENIPWTTGSACIASDSNEFWEENKIHQRFIEDQRLAADAGIIKDNPVATYLRNYYEENPLDDSFEGVLARYSGMAKEDVIATLDLIEGLNYIANYHPEERLAFGIEETDYTIYFEETEDDFSRFVAAEPKYIVYDTLRNKATIG